MSRTRKSGDWHCLVCGSKVAESQVGTPDECPFCQGPAGIDSAFGRIA